MHWSLTRYARSEPSEVASRGGRKQLDANDKTYDKYYEHVKQQLGTSSPSKFYAQQCLKARMLMPQLSSLGEYDQDSPHPS